MHEIEIADRLINAIVDEAKKCGIKKITGAHLKIGKMNGLEYENFKHALAARKEDTLHNAKLTIVEVPVKLACDHCGNEFIDKRFDDAQFAHATSHAPHFYLTPPCPACKKEGAKIIGGKELKLVSIDGE